METPSLLVGPKGQLYAQPHPSADPTSFSIDNTSEQYYNSPYFLAHKQQVQPIPLQRPGALPNISLSDFIDPNLLASIQDAGRIAFHAVGDTGAAKVNHQQTVQQALANEQSVIGAMTQDLQGPSAPAFFFHLGDIVYSFGERKYYYDQFYDPTRGYDRPIFAIPGNHDGMVFGPSSSTPANTSLDGFMANFVAPAPGPAADAGGLVRSTMTQPGAFFTLDAPFVSIIGLYSNVLDGPGVISSQGGQYPLQDIQLAFLENELNRLKAPRADGERAVIIAIHHPPLSVDAAHGGSTGPEADIAAICTKVGYWPDAILSGHAHLYQRFTRRIGATGQQIPYIVSGSGGYAATAPKTAAPAAPATIGDYTLEVDPIIKFGYLFCTCDAKTLTFEFRSPTSGGTTTLDTVSVDLKSKTITGAPSTPAAAVKTTGTSSKKTAPVATPRVAGKRPAQRPAPARKPAAKSPAPRKPAKRSSPAPRRAKRSG